MLHDYLRDGLVLSYDKVDGTGLLVRKEAKVSSMIIPALR